MHNLMIKIRSLINTNRRKILLILFVIMITSFVAATIINLSTNWLEDFIQRVINLT